MIGIARRRIPLLNDDGRGVIDGYEYVDLGLPSGLLWATCNVGATSETEYGNYYQWGAGSTQYANRNQYYTGTTSPLPLTYDTARKVMGGSWRMPTRTEYQELIDNTTYTWETDFNGSGVNGGKFTASNGNYIFIPAAGCYADGMPSSVSTDGDVWSSTPRNSTNAYDLYFGTDDKFLDYNYRYLGMSVRGVISA